MKEDGDPRLCATAFRLVLLDLTPPPGRAETFLMTADLDSGISGFSIAVRKRAASSKRRLRAVARLFGESLFDYLFNRSG